MSSVAGAIGVGETGLSTGEHRAFGEQAAGRYGALLDRLRAGLNTLGDKPEETPISALRALWLRAQGHAVSADGAMECNLAPLAPHDEQAVVDLVDRRLQGVPLAHLTGRQRFCGMELEVGPGALIPRRETELLARAAVRLLERAVEQQGHASAIDVCTGAGNVAAALAMGVPQARVWASDLSEDAVRLAARNAVRLGLSARLELRCGDLLAPFTGAEFERRIDVLTCNPPYISTGKVSSMPNEIAEFEPSLAFDGGPFGVRILNRLVQEAPALVRPGGWVLTEVGLGQGPSVLRRFRAAGAFVEVEGLADEHGEIRAVAARVGS